MNQTRLSYPPTPEQACQWAEEIAVHAQELVGHPLDYAPESLRAIDALVERYRSEGKNPRELETMLFRLGCYVGEVLVRHDGASWCRAEESELKGSTRWPIVIRLSSGAYTCPIDRVFRRLENGSVDDLDLYYRMTRVAGTEEDAPPPSMNGMRVSSR